MENLLLAGAFLLLLYAAICLLLVAIIGLRLVWNIWQALNVENYD